MPCCLHLRTQTYSYVLDFLTNHHPFEILSKVKTTQTEQHSTAHHIITTHYIEKCNTSTFIFALICFKYKCICIYTIYVKIQIHMHIHLSKIRKPSTSFIFCFEFYLTLSYTHVPAQPQLLYFSKPTFVRMYIQSYRVHEFVCLSLHVCVCVCVAFVISLLMDELLPNIRK